MMFVWLVVVAVLMTESGRRRQPGLGVIGGLGVVAGLIWLGDEPAAAFGLMAPRDWLATAGAAILIGTGIQLLAVMVVEPLSERLTGERHDLSLVESVRSSRMALIQWLVVVWVVVAFVEELIFRGFLLGGLVDELGGGAVAVVTAVIASSVVFGLAHLYQGRAGALSTGMIGAILGVVFVAADRNLWLPILTHGVIDTVGLSLIATGHAERLARWSPLSASEGERS